MFFDLHCDTITRLMMKKESLYENTGHVDVKRLFKYDSPVQTFAICLDGKGVFDEAADAIKFFLSELETNKNYIRLVKNKNDIAENKKLGLISAVLAIEGGEILEGNLNNINKLYDLGVRIFTLTWNTRNELGYGAFCENLGLTDFGMQSVQKLTELKMIIDVSHLSEKGFWNTLECSDASIIASHSNCAAICPNPRNLSDEQIKALADKNYIIGINFYPFFLSGDIDACIYDILAHIQHIVKIGGEDTPAIGSDFDGVKFLPREITDVSYIEKLYYSVSSVYNQNFADKIFYKNPMRIFNRV